MAWGLLLPGVGDEVLITFCCGILIVVIAAAVTFTNFFGSARPAEINLATGSAHQSYNNEVCPICLSPQALAVETNCGHKFCGPCLRSYLNNRSPGDFSVFSGRLSCPLCRQDINILLLSFTREETHSAELEEERRNVEATANEYNIRFGAGPRNLWTCIRDCPVLIRHMLQEMFTLGGIVWMFRLRVLLFLLGAFLYLCIPIDFFPEALFGIFGFLDDLIVFLLCAVYISVIYRRLVISRGHPHDS